MMAPLPARFSLWSLQQQATAQSKLEKAQMMYVKDRTIRSTFSSSKNFLYQLPDNIYRLVKEDKGKVREIHIYSDTTTMTTTTDNNN